MKTKIMLLASLMLLPCMPASALRRVEKRRAEGFKAEKATLPDGDKRLAPGLAPAAPDLIGWGGASGQASGAVTVYIKNIGKVDSGRFIVRAIVRHTKGGPTESHDVMVRGLKAGEETSVNFQFKPPLWDAYGWAEIDATNNVAETNEKNNIQKFGTPSAPQSLRPDGEELRAPDRFKRRLREPSSSAR
jgi:hypothetical protein